jgi:glutaredoxin-like YruB-family protein
MNQVIVYSTPTCPYCNYAKEFLADNKISFEDKNVASDSDAAREMVRKSNQMGVPVIDINGSIVVGYDPNELSRLLGL